MVTSRPLNYWCINANTICQSNSKLLVSTWDRLFPLIKNDYPRFAQTPQGNLWPKGHWNVLPFFGPKFPKVCFELNFPTSLLCCIIELDCRGAISTYSVNTKSSDIRKILWFNHAPCIFNWFFSLKRKGKNEN